MPTPTLGKSRPGRIALAFVSPSCRFFIGSALLLCQCRFYRDAVPLATPARFDVEPVQFAGNGAVAHPLPFEAAHNVQHFRRGPAGDVDGAGNLERGLRSRIAEL